MDHVYCVTRHIRIIIIKKKALYTLYTAKDPKNPTFDEIKVPAP